MDFSFELIHDVIHPTAAFSGLDEGRSSQDERSSGNDSGSGEISWDNSQLNPKNRIDSLEPLSRPLWRLDGSTGFGTQYFAIPLFLSGIAPMRIDVFIYEAAMYPPPLRRLLDLDRAFSIKDARRIRQLGISQHILRILQWHTTHPDGTLHPDVVERCYQRGPFGSRIVIDSLSCHVHETRIHIYPNHPLEQELLPYHELLKMWGLAEKRGKETGVEAKLPPEMDISDVILVRQLADSVCEVHIRGDAQYENQLIVLKSLNSSVKYMYHELRMLLRDVPAHAHVIGRPLHVISKQCMFGGKHGVIGFTIPYHPVGTLRDVLPLLRLHGRLALADQLRWARQLAQALCHIWHHGHCYYPDLRLDNIVLSAPAPAGDVVVIDFEQRGVWSGFSSREVDHVENLRILARDDPDVASANPDITIPEDECEKAKQALAACWVAAAKADGQEQLPSESSDLAAVAETLARLEDNTRYDNPKAGYNVTWICLTRREQEAAMVYMLGRVLWCIFEGMSAPHRGAVWQSYRWEPEPGEVEFPAYRQTPAAVQALIGRCLGDGTTREQNQFVRQGNKIYMKEETSEDGTSYTLVSDHLASRARAFWREQLAEGDAWLQERHRRLLHGQEADVQGRLSLREVSAALDELQKQLLPGQID